MSDQLVILDQGFKINEATEKPAMIDSKMMPMPRGGKVIQVPTLESPSNACVVSCLCGGYQAAKPQTTLGPSIVAHPSEENEISKNIKIMI